MYFDDSEKNNIALAGGVLCCQSDKSYIIEQINKIKKNNGIPHELPLHCRQFFAEHQRDKLNKKFGTNLQEENAFKMYSEIFSFIRQAQIFPIICYANKRQFPKKFPAVIDENQTKWPEFSCEGKNLIACGIHALIQHLESALKSDLSYYISKDSTKITYLGRKKQASGVRMFVTKKSKSELSKIQELGEHPILELADAVSFFSSTSLSRQVFKPNSKSDILRKFCTNIYNQLNLIEMQFKLKGGGLSVQVIRDDVLQKIT